MKNQKKPKKRKNLLKDYDFAWKFKLKVCLPLFAVLLAFDWITKLIVQFDMHQGETKEFMPGFLRFNYIINPGSAYGFNAQNLALAVSLATVITLVLIVAFIFVNAHAWLPGMAVAIAGSLGNLVARSWAPVVAAGQPNAGAKGGVVDFLQWQFGILNSDNYIFNLADVWVICGIIMVVLGAIISAIIYGVKKRDENRRQAVLIVDVPVKPKAGQKKEFIYKDETKLSPQQLKLYRKELKAYQKMKKMEEKTNAKDSRRNSAEDSSR